MTRSFKNYEEVQKYFERYNFSNWLTNTFELTANENNIKKVTWSLSEGIGTFRVLYETNFSHHAGTYSLIDVNDLLLVLKEIVTDPFS